MVFEFFSFEVYNWLVGETIEKAARHILTAPENWVVAGKLLWPPNEKLAISKRKKQCPPESDWIVYDFKILAGPFGKLTM